MFKYCVAILNIFSANVVVGEILEEWIDGPR